MDFVDEILPCNCHRVSSLVLMLCYLAGLAIRC